MHDDLILASDFNGLTAAQPSLPARWYTDPAHFDREMREIYAMVQNGTPIQINP